MNNKYNNHSFQSNPKRLFNWYLITKLNHWLLLFSAMQNNPSNFQKQTLRQAIITRRKLVGLVSTEYYSSTACNMFQTLNISEEQQI